MAELPFKAKFFPDVVSPVAGRCQEERAVSGFKYQDYPGFSEDWLPELENT